GRVRARDARARRNTAGRDRDTLRRLRAVGPRHEARDRARRVHDHDRAELAGSQERQAHGRPVRQGLNRRSALKLLGGGSLAALAFAQAPRAFAQAAPLYKDAAAPIPARVADLMARMTLAEKIAQIRAAWQGKGEMIDGLVFNPAKARAAFPGGIGQITRASDKRGVPGITGAAGGTAARWRTPQETVEFVN